MQTDKELLELARTLIPEQKIVLKEVVKYCKNISTPQKSVVNPQLRLIVHGGAGVGKSQTINTCSQWAEKILRREGSNQDLPRVLLLAPTGVSANLIGGQTVHSAFSFKFGTDYTPITIDKTLHNMQVNLSELKLIIIDEMSMISSDMLYNIHHRLCDILGSKNIFAGRGMVLVGDLFQLKPVHGRFIFEQPFQEKYEKHFHSAESIWNSCNAVTLVHNHRQDAGSEWAEALNRFRNASHTEDDVALLRERVIDDPDDPKFRSASHTMYKRIDVYAHNKKMIESTDTKEYVIPAICHSPIAPKISPDGVIDNTPFMKNLKIKEGSRIMLVLNIGTTDGLVNGAFGTIIKVVVNKNHQVDHLIVKFDNPKTGKNQRASKPS